MWPMSHLVHSSVTNCIEIENMCFSFNLVTRRYFLTPSFIVFLRHGE